VCFFSATLHSPQITQLSNQICINPTWVDLKGFDSVPDTVHHVVYRIDPLRDVTIMKRARIPAITDNVHVLVNGNTNSMDYKSQQVKEIKMHLLVEIIDKYNVRLYLSNKFVL
jgi:ATP-dependent RNA helicase DDX1